MVPKAVASKVYGVVGLSNTVREQSNIVRNAHHAPARSRDRAPRRQPAGV